MSASEKLQNEVERQKRKIEEIEKSIETVEKEFNEKFDYERESIEEHKKFLAEPELEIAIVGTINAGKSTFINALLQENIASTDARPETASLTKFKYADENKLEIKFYNEEEWNELWESVEESKKKHQANVFKEEFENSGAKNIKNDWLGKPNETIEESNIEKLKNTIKDYTSRQSEIHYFVKEITVYLNNDNMPKDVTIVDTPGLDDVVDYRSNITKKYIKRANAVIVCVDATNLRKDEYLTITKVFENVGDDKYKVMILGTKIDEKNNPKENWEKQSKEWKKYLEDNFKDENLLNNNIIGVSSYIFSNLIELENTGKCDKVNKIIEFAENYGINLTPENGEDMPMKIYTEMQIKAALEKSSQIRDITNIEKVNSLMKGNIISKGTEIAMKDLESKYSNMITNISNKAKTIKDSNSQSRASLDMDRKQQEEFKLMKNKEIEEIEKAMNGLNEAFENIKTEWLNQNKKLKEAIKK